MVTRIRRDKLVVMRLLLLVLLGRAVLIVVVLIQSTRTCTSRRIVAETRQADRACLHVLARDTNRRWYNDSRLGCFLSLHVRGPCRLWRIRWMRLGWGDSGRIWACMS